MVARSGGTFQVVALDTDYDDYGAVPSNFRVIAEFPCNFWHRESMDVRDHGTGGQAKFYRDADELGIVLHDGFGEGAADEQADDEGVEFTLGHQRFRILGAASLEEVREGGFVYGTSEPRTLSIEC